MITIKRNRGQIYCRHCGKKAQYLWEISGQNDYYCLPCIRSAFRRAKKDDEQRN